MCDDDSVELFNRWRNGDETAAEAIFRRYLQRLLALARRRMSASLCARLDAEDIVQSVYASFFRRAAEGSFTLHRGGDLWRLLAQITVNKTCGTAGYHQAHKRSLTLEVSIDNIDAASFGELFARDPSPEEAAVFAEELDRVLQGLRPVSRDILEYRLAGATTADIAREVDRTVRTVRRVLEHVRRELTERLASSDRPLPADPSDVQHV